MDIRQQKSEFPIKSGQDVAKYLVYFHKSADKRRTREINIANVSGAVLYKKHKKVLDKLFAVQEKYGLDLVRYSKFFIDRFNYTDENIEKITDPQYIMWYAEMLKTNAKHQKIYSYVMKSVENIVNDCVDLHYSSVKEYFRHLVTENQLAQKYVSGKISGYYLAGIKNLKKIVKKMDSLSQDTLREIVENQESILSEVQDAFLYVRRIRVSIISFTNEKLYSKLGLS